MPATGFSEKIEQLFVAELAKVQVGLANGMQAGRLYEHLNSIGFIQMRIVTGNRYRRRYNNAGSLIFSTKTTDGHQRYAGSDAIIHEDHRFTGHIRQRPSAAVGSYPSLDFLLLCGYDPVNGLPGKHF